MKKAVLLTEEQKQQRITYTPIVVSEYEEKYRHGYGRDNYWYCSLCNVLFEGNDTVLLRVSDAERPDLVCPLMRKSVLKRMFGTVRRKFCCYGRLTYGSKEYFEKNYGISDL